MGSDRSRWLGFVAVGGNGGGAGENFGEQADEGFPLGLGKRLHERGQHHVDVRSTQ